LGRNDRIKDRSLKAFFEEYRNEINWDRADRAWLDEVIGNAKGEESSDEQAIEHEPALPHAIPQDSSGDPCGYLFDPDRTATSTHAHAQGKDPESQNSRAHAANLQRWRS
jgi:hypothetical protein